VHLHKRDAHPVHVDFIDSQTFLQRSLVDGLNQMGADTPLISVKRASQKLGRISGDSKADVVCISLSRSSVGGISIVLFKKPLLLQAVEDFRERIVPVFTKVDTQKEEVDRLRDELRKLRRDKEHLQGKLKKIEPLQTEIGRLKTVLLETEQNTDEALRLAESAKDELASHHDNANQWKKRTTELEQENKRYRDMLDRQSNNVSATQTHVFIEIVTFYN
jgi:cell shape-determining protein MreC